MPCPRSGAGRRRGVRVGGSSVSRFVRVPRPRSTRCIQIVLLSELEGNRRFSTASHPEPVPGRVEQEA